MESELPVPETDQSPTDDVPSIEDPIAMVNRLHEVLSTAGLHHADLGLPLIAVVGSQSVGKTSVLESIVGLDFLPRGTGIVTRRPLVLKLKWIPSPGGNSDTPKVWAEFDHLPAEQFPIENIRAEIERETFRLCGSIGISDRPIGLSIFSPHVMDLTLVDLPGLTKVPIEGQAPDIVQKIRNLVLGFVKERSSIILAISAANVDLATSDALALARQVDPLGERTLGVLTKLDLADESGSAVEALLGRVYPLRLGYVGVVCRSEAKSRAGMTFAGAVKAEEEFFAQSPTLKPLVGQCGIPFLARRLQVLLFQHIREVLPDFRARVQQVTEDCRKELESFGDEDSEQRMGKGPFLLHLISGYVRNFADGLDGRLAYHQSEVPPDRLVGGARLHYIFHKVFAQAILDFDVFSGLTDLEIRMAMRNAAGPKPQLFVPEIAFESLVKRQIQKLEDPSLQCVQLVFEELKRIASQSEVLEMQRFPGLREKILEVSHAVIRSCLQPTNQTVTNLICMEREYINVDHPDFIGGHRAMSQIQESSFSTKSQASMASLPTEASPTEEAPPQVPASSSGWPSSRSGGVQSPPSPPRTARRSRWGTVSAPEEPLRLPAVPLVVTPSGEPTEKERKDTELLKTLVSSYYTIVKRKIVDAVPKTIMRFMVNSVRDALHHECISTLYKSELFDELLTEADETRQQRSNCEHRFEELRRAQEIMSRICDAAATQV